MRVTEVEREREDAFVEVARWRRTRDAVVASQTKARSNVRLVTAARYMAVARGEVLETERYMALSVALVAMTVRNVAVAPLMAVEGERGTAWGKRDAAQTIRELLARYVVTAVHATDAVQVRINRQQSQLQELVCAAQKMVQHSTQLTADAERLRCERAMMKAQILRL